MVEAVNHLTLHPTSIYIYIYCVSETFICCGWGYGCTLMLISVQVEVDFWKIEGMVEHN
jgi:hypothetical protein